MASTVEEFGLDCESSVAILERMLLIRRFEEKVIELSAAGHRFGVIHVYIGQEGTGAAVLQAAAPHDRIFTNHRNHGHVIGRGADPAKAFAEMMGRSTGLLGGRAGGQHLADATLGILHTSAMIGGGISLAVGAAYAAQRTGDNRVAIAFFGDSVLEEGVTYEALNLASLWKLPILFVCENNSLDARGITQGGYPTLVHSAQTLTRVPESLGIQTLRISDGADAAEIYTAARSALNACRTNKGPFFIESLTVRWPGSQTIIPKASTRTDLRMALDDSWMTLPRTDWASRHDPLLKWVRHLVMNGHATPKDILTRDALISSRIEKAADVAAASPYPDAATAFDRVFA